MAVEALGRAVVAVLAGLTTWLAFPPMGWWPLAIVGVAGLTWVVHGQRVWRGAWLGALYGLAWFTPYLAWISVLGRDVLLYIAVAESVFTALLGAGIALVTRLRAWPVLVALVWVGYELVLTVFPVGGFPWSRLGYPQVESPLGSFARYGGPALASFVVALLGGLLAWVIVERRTRALGVAALSAAVLVLAGIVLQPPGTPADADAEPVTVALVQGDVPGEGMDALGEARQVTRNHRDATEELAARVARGEVAQPDVVIWPENATDIDPFNDAETREVVDAGVAAAGVPVLVGAILDGPGEDFRRTAGIVWDPVTGPDLDQVYVKRHPVPFGEYIPFREQLLPVFGRLEQVGRETYPGDEPGVLELGPLTVGDVICFEIAYDGIVRDVVDGGAEVLVVQTNNATYTGTDQPEQQWLITRMQAIATGRTVLVASTNGISGVIAPDGSVVERTSPGTRDEIVAEVTPSTVTTLASRFGPWPERGLAAAGLAAVAAAIVIGVRRREGRARG